MTIVENIAERINKIDIGLVALKNGITFNNRFLGLDSATAKVLIPSKDVKYPDKFVVDSFTTSVQCLICHSRRIRKLNLRTERLYRASEGTKLPGLVAYIVVEQGIIATSESEIRGTPQIQEVLQPSPLQPQLRD